MPGNRILIIDDEKLIRWSLKSELHKEGYDISTAETGEEGMGIIKDEMPDLILLDMKLPDIDGLEILEKIKSIDKNALVIIITAFGEVDVAVKVMKLGAYDFVCKPFNLDEVKITIRNALNTKKLKNEVHSFKSLLKTEYGLENIVGKSRPMLEVFSLVDKIAKSDTKIVLIRGESGTGKDLIARTIHFQSSRADHPYVEVDCTSLPETLIESELFGHVKGSFTDAKTAKKGLIELADGGSIFFDEIGDMMPSTQAKLLRVIENRTFKRVGGITDIKVDIRVIAATNKDLVEGMKNGRFREDLYYRLNVIPIKLPPLREREGDIPFLANHFINIFNKEFKRSIKSINKDALDILQNYHWPGNVRELKNVIERAIILESGNKILAQQLPIEITSPREVREEGVFEVDLSGNNGVSLEEVEKELMRKALRESRGNKTKAASLLNISRHTLNYRIKKYGL